MPDAKSDLRDYLQGGREALLWKLEGLPEYDARRPLTPTGTNLLGLVKHLAVWEFRYFGEVFGRPPAEVPPWPDESGMWAAAGEGREYITGWYRRAWAHADATIDALSLDAAGHVPWRCRGDAAPHHGAHGRGYPAACGACRHRPGAHRRGSRAASGQQQHAGARPGWVGGSLEPGGAGRQGSRTITVCFRAGRTPPS